MVSLIFILVLSFYLYGLCVGFVCLFSLTQSCYVNCDEEDHIRLDFLFLIFIHRHHLNYNIADVFSFITGKNNNNNKTHFCMKFPKWFSYQPQNQSTIFYWSSFNSNHHSRWRTVPVFSKLDYWWFYQGKYPFVFCKGNAKLRGKIKLYKVLLSANTNDKTGGIHFSLLWKSAWLHTIKCSQNC